MLTVAHAFTLVCPLSQFFLLFCCTSIFIRDPIHFQCDVFLMRAFILGSMSSRMPFRFLGLDQYCAMFRFLSIWFITGRYFDDMGCCNDYLCHHCLGFSLIFFFSTNSGHSFWGWLLSVMFATIFYLFIYFFFWGGGRLLLETFTLYGHTVLCSCGLVLFFLIFHKMVWWKSIIAVSCRTFLPFQAFSCLFLFFFVP